MRTNGKTTGPTLLPTDEEIKGTPGRFQNLTFYTPGAAGGGAEGGESTGDPAAGEQPGSIVHGAVVSAIPANSSGVIGRRFRVRPVAWRRAAAIAAGLEMRGGSPAPFAP